jgi:hypothetical protein
VIKEILVKYMFLSNRDKGKKETKRKNKRKWKRSQEDSSKL